MSSTLADTNCAAVWQQSKNNEHPGVNLQLTLSSFVRPDCRMVANFWPSDTFATVLDAARNVLPSDSITFCSSNQTPARLWLSPPAGDCCGSGGFELVTDYTLPLRGRVRTGQCALIELRTLANTTSGSSGLSNSFWPRDEAAAAALSVGAVLDARSGLLDPVPLPADVAGTVEVGFCGLTNAGGDCSALNAAIQLLCGVPRFVDSLLSLQPDGSGRFSRPLTDAVCELLRAMTSGLYEFVSARAVRRILLRRLAATMSDSESAVNAAAAELSCMDYLTCLLDSLHQELVSSTAHCQLTEESASSEVVTNLFSGQVVSVTECLLCGHSAKACQQFFCLNLTQPPVEKQLRPFHFCLVRSPGATVRQTGQTIRYRPLRCSVEAPSTGQCGDLSTLIGTKFAIRSDCLLLTHLTDGKVARVFYADDWYTDYGHSHQSDAVFCYQLDQPAQTGRDAVVAFVYLAECPAMPAFPIALSLTRRRHLDCESLQSILSGLFDGYQFDVYKTDCRAVAFSRLPSEALGQPTTNLSSGSPVEYFAAVPRLDGDCLSPAPPPRPEWFRGRCLGAQDYDWHASRCQATSSSSRRIRLTDCLSSLWQPGRQLNRFNAWLCQSCGAFGQAAARRSRLAAPLPPVLLLRLDSNSSDRLQLDFPTRGFCPVMPDPVAVSYDLLAAAWSCGSEPCRRGGQYIVCARGRQSDGCRWYRCEDGRSDCLPAESRLFDEAAMWGRPCALVYGRRSAD